MLSSLMNNPENSMSGISTNGAADNATGKLENTLAMNIPREKPDSELEVML